MTARRKLIRRTALAATAGVAALVLAACGGGDGGHDMGSMESDSSPSASAPAKAGDHNDADMDFATEMVQHHRQAVDMAELAADRASSQEVKDLAMKIKGAQDPEIKTMSGWLTSWGEEAPADMSGMEGHDMSPGMPGMMSSEDMDKLTKASGAEFDEMFLEMMVEHHEGAIEMARTEKADGKYSPATKLADDVITAQTAEIEQMNKMLGQS
ncbi:MULTISPECIES: DUF305 domain-containing protein [unclassified Streptomyces]|uniref:DUF305 domain-containing protein n=1 Tax=unclassified Streptomyces TaxID=2593676 RepID=UPI00225406B3|nr:MULTISPECIES: DUF305 domain-containing protein [unclassified Streptomyces]MCX5328660.1 DUF305 domain-containing protein [Streptomyces sp. NBC_00140]MCX5358073.1 DUF305 domain-containing protein [Streptomyces sp. NBC_00124]